MSDYFVFAVIAVEAEMKEQERTERGAYPQWWILCPQKC